MLIIGELINSSRKAIRPAIEEYDAKAVQELVIAQSEAGANYIDVNCGTFVDDEEERMAWLVETIQEVTDLPLSIDTPDTNVLARGLSLCKNGQPFVNSITAEKERFAATLPLVVQYKAKVVALCMDDNGMPTTMEERVDIATRLIEGLTQGGVLPEDIYIDPLVKPVSTSDQAGKDVLNTITAIKNAFPAVNFICGLSNVSFGLPNRKWINRTFMIQTMTMGMNSYILNPTDQVMMAMLYASDALLGQDPFCGKFIAAHRKGLYENI